jgi:hypothetical protein
MRKSSKLLFAGLTAAFLMSLAVSSASASHLALNEQRFDAKWSALRFIAGGNTVTCPVTLEGSFHYGTINKVENSLIGHISRASVANASCSGGHATVLSATLPWHVQYAGFSGTLPNITEVQLKLIGASFAVQPTGSISCLARTSAEHPARGSVALNTSHVATTLTAEVNAGIPLTGGLGACSFAGEGHFEGTTASLTRLGGAGSITVTLI